MDTYRNNSNNINSNGINSNAGNNGNAVNAKGPSFTYYQHQNQNFNHRNNKFNNQNANNNRNNNNMNRNNRNQNGNNSNMNNQNSVLMQTNRFDNANLLDFQTGNNFANKNFNNGPKQFNNFNNGQNFKNHNSINNQNNQNNSANNQNFKKGKLNKKRSFSKKYPNNGNSNNNEYMGERLNKSLNKDPSPNNSYMEMGQKMQSSISLDNFSLADIYNNKTNRSPKMPNSFTTFLNNHPMYQFNQSSNTIIEQDMAEQQPESQSIAAASSIVEDKSAYYMNDINGSVRQQMSADESSFYSTPLNHTLPPKYNVDPSMSPAKHEHEHENRTIELTEDDGITPIKYDTEKTLLSSHTLHGHQLINDHHNRHQKAVSSSSSSSTSPDAKDESQPLVTASEGESSFGLEPTIENTITNVAIETSFANEIEHASGHVLGMSIKKFLDLDLKAGIDEQEESQAKDASEVESQNTSLKQADNSTADSTATEDSTSSSSSSSSSSSPVTSCTIETSSSNVKTISSSSLTSSSSSHVSSTISEQKKLAETVQLTPASLENNSNLFNYEKHINNQSNHSSGSNIDQLNLKSSCPVEINYSTQTNYPSSTNSDYSISSSSNCSQTKSSEEQELTSPGTEFDINSEVSTLVNKIVLDAVAQAVKNPLKNESYIEIDINDTLTDTTHKEKLIIEDPILEEEQQKATLDQEANVVHYTSEDQKVVAATGAGTGDQSMNVNTSTLMNESTLTVNSLAKKSSTSIKKDPLVDCFSCTIV